MPLNKICDSERVRPGFYRLTQLSSYNLIVLCTGTRKFMPGKAVSSQQLDSPGKICPAYTGNIWKLRVPSCFTAEVHGHQGHLSLQWPHFLEHHVLRSCILCSEYFARHSRPYSLIGHLVHNLYGFCWHYWWANILFLFIVAAEFGLGGIDFCIFNLFFLMCGLVQLGGV